MRLIRKSQRNACPPSPPTSARVLKPRGRSGSCRRRSTWSGKRRPAQQMIGLIRRYPARPSWLTFIGRQKCGRGDVFLARCADDTHSFTPSLLHSFTEELQGCSGGPGLRRFHHVYGDHIYEAAWLAHALRKFHDSTSSRPSPRTTEALALIGALYAITIRDQLPVTVNAPTLRTQEESACRREMRYGPYRP